MDRPPVDLLHNHGANVCDPGHGRRKGVSFHIQILRYLLSHVEGHDKAEIKKSPFMIIG